MKNTYNYYKIPYLSIIFSGIFFLQNAVAKDGLTSLKSNTETNKNIYTAEQPIDPKKSQPNLLQKKIVSLSHSGMTFNEHQLFTPMSRSAIRMEKSAAVDFAKKANEVQASFMTLNQQVLTKLYRNPEETIIINFPINGKNSSGLTSANQSGVKVKLFRNKLYTDNALFMKKSSPEENGKQLDRNQLDLGVHYHGVVSGEQDSIVAISLFKNSIEGRIHSHQMGDLNIGRMKLKDSSNHKSHVVFKVDSIEKENSLHECGSTLSADLKRSGLDYSKDILNLRKKSAGMQDTKALYDYYFTTKTVISGYLTYAVGEGYLSNWVSSVLNQAAAVYSVEGVNLYSEGWLYYTNSPVYDSAKGAYLIEQFNYYDGSSVTNSDVGIVLTGPGSANSGGLAYDIGGVCSGNRLNRLSMAKVNSSWSYFPYYSWTVDVYVHEIGHTLGARHTHACVWNGNNTAIDGCAGFTEGSCRVPGLPASGQGTVMSYCHSSVGKNPALGFGSQPGQTIRSYVYYCASR
ncbi:M12 family metallo-peptidase [Aliikangiella sp. IMCC44359]|uniref:M12 family metallo-peptidase n=1 Tax=Aliikangiella sp. IMCC44359 TaxID=3459125 RepID=UPI00403A9239